MDEPTLTTVGQPQPPEPADGTGSGHGARPLLQLPDWQARITRSLLRVTAGLGLIVVIAETALLAPLGRWDLLVVIYAAYAAVLALALIPALSFRLRAAGFLTLFYAVGVFNLSQSGLSGDGRLFLLAFPLLALILLGKRSGVLALALSLVALVIVGWAMATGRYAPAVESRSSETLPWVTGVAVYLLLVVVVLFPSGYLITTLVANLSRALGEARARWSEVQALSHGLEQQVAERTVDLAAVAEVARQTAALTDQQELLESFVHLIDERFNLYHVGLFLVDAQEEQAILYAASSEGGQRMIQRGHRVRLDSHNLIAQVIRSGEASLPVARALPTPDLPRTHWRAVLPVRIGQRVFGALDIHSSDEQPFSAERALALQTLTDQLAIGLENARLFDQMRASLEELTGLYQVVTVEAWQKFVGAPETLNRFQVGAAGLPDEAWMPLFEQARSLGRSVTACCTAGTDGVRHALAVPVKLRDVPIGVVGLHRPMEAGEWLPEEIALAEGVAERVALALENVRLLEETRRRAARERLVREVADQMQQATDLGALVRTAAEELNRALGTSRAYVRLGAPSGLGED